MSEQEIIEGNKLIAEFMEVDFICANSRYIVTDEDWLEPYHHRFNSSWDLLMPVIKKCAKSGIYYSKYEHDLKHALIDIDIELCLEIIVKYITLYNKTYDKQL